MRKLLLLGVAAVSLSACNSGLFGGGVASPQRKAGLWEETRTSDMSPTPSVMKLCLDEASDKRLPVLGRKPRRAGACEKYSVSKNGNTYVIDSVCGFGGTKLTNHTELSGDFQTTYTSKSTISVEGASDPARNGQHTTTLTATYKGACPPEIQPGQVQLPSGEVVDMAQLRRGFGGGNGGNSATNSTGGGGGNPAGGGGRPD